MKLVSWGMWGSATGVLLIVAGLMLSGGFGPCGPQHMGPFLMALAGLGVAVLGVATLAIGALVATVRRFRRPA